MGLEYEVVESEDFYVDFGGGLRSFEATLEASKITLTRPEETTHLNEERNYARQ